MELFRRRDISNSTTSNSSTLNEATIAISSSESGEDDEDGLDWVGVNKSLKRLKDSCKTQHRLYVNAYLEYRRLRVWYETPVIVFSGINSVLIAGGNGFIKPEIVNIMTCMLALVVGIIQSVRTFLRVDSSAEDCLTTYRDLFRLYRDLVIMLDLPVSARKVDPDKFLQDKKAEYDKIMDSANILGSFQKSIAIYDD